MNRNIYWRLLPGHVKNACIILILPTDSGSQHTAGKNATRIRLGLHLRSHGCDTKQIQTEANIDSKPSQRIQFGYQTELSAVAFVEAQMMYEGKAKGKLAW